MRKLQIKTLADRVGGYGTWVPPMEPVSDGPCRKENCTTFCWDGRSAQCCCDYVCPSGRTYACIDGYCPNTYTSCM